jgi:hypothetical protein
VFVLLLYLVVLPIAAAVIAFRCVVLFPIKCFKIGPIQAFLKYRYSFLVVGLLFVTCVVNVTGFSWKRLGRVPKPELVDSAITYAYGTTDAYNQVLGQHFPDYVADAQYYFTYFDSSDEYNYGFWDKVFGDDTYLVVLPEWRVLLNKHGAPITKKRLQASDQPTRSGNVFGIIAHFSNVSVSGPVLTELAHFDWQVGTPISSTIKGDCIAFLTASEKPRVAIYRAPGTDFKNYIVGLDADSFGYGLKSIELKRAVLNGGEQYEIAQRDLTQEEFDVGAKCAAK